MAQEVHAPCPGCKKVLRFPADAVNKTLRCKYCGTAVRVKQKPSPATPAKTAAQLAPAPSAPTAGSPSSAPPVASSAPAPSSDVGTPQSLEGTFAHMLPTVPEATAFAPDPGAPIIRTPLYGRRPTGFRRGALLVGLLLLAAAVAGTYQLWPQLATIPGRPKGNPTDPQPDLPTVSGDLPTGGVFPRRALAISVNNYLYANPVSYGSPDHNVHTLVQRIARVLHVQPSQIVELSDATPPKPPGKESHEKPGPDSQRLDLPARPPIKPVVEKTISAFLETSRPQDRILVLFVGHVVEIGTEAFLVPLEGEPAVKETLIPLSWLYEQLARCRARQKLLIVDSCRLDPSCGLERPGSEPMTATLDGLLQKPPAGVQIWSACTSGQYSYESNGRGVFLDKLHDALTVSVLQKIQEPPDPLPIETVAQVVNQRTAAEVASRISSLAGQKAVQTPRLTGQMLEQGAPYDKDEPLPREIHLPAPSLPSGGVAERGRVQSIMQEIDLPPIKLARDQHTPPEIAAVLPFSAEVIERYRPDYRSLTEIEHDSAKHPLRVQVVETVKLLRATFDPKGPRGSLREYFQGGSNERIKAAIFKEQMKPARLLAELTERLEELRKAGEQRDQEPSPRWQAHYDYILAQLLARTAYVSEYDLMLGKIRKDELPELRPNLSSGWRLASREKMQSGKDVKDMAAESKKLFEKVINDHPGTPWEILAKRERLTALGLEWQPSS